MILKQVKTNSIVKKHNYLIEAKHTKLLDVRALRLVALAASKITIRDKDFTTYHIPVKEITNSSDVYSKIDEETMVIDKITDQLLSGVLKFPQKDKDGKKSGESFVKYAYFSKCRYIKGSGYIEVQFHPDLKPFYLDLKGNYTQLSMEILRVLPSAYSFRLYELLKQYAQGGIYRRAFVLNELYDQLAVKPGKKSSYRNWSKFREKVILPAQKNFEKFTDLTFEFNGWAEFGRAFTDVEFIMRKNKKFFQGDLFQKTDPEKAEIIDIIPQSVMDKIPPIQWDDKKIGCKQVVSQILDAQGVEALQFYIDHVAEQDRKKKVDSWGKYIRFCWKNKHYEEHVIHRAKTEKQREAVKAQNEDELEEQIQKQQENDQKKQKDYESIEKLNAQIDQILKIDQGDLFISFVEEQVRTHESQFMIDRFRKNKGNTRQEIYRRYLTQFKEQHNVTSPEDDENYSLVDWLDVVAN